MHLRYPLFFKAPRKVQTDKHTNLEGQTIQSTMLPEERRGMTHGLTLPNSLNINRCNRSLSTLCLSLILTPPTLAVVANQLETRSTCLTRLSRGSERKHASHLEVDAAGKERGRNTRILVASKSLNIGRCHGSPSINPLPIFDCHPLDALHGRRSTRDTFNLPDPPLKRERILRHKPSN